jgi:hypothetical protein
MLELYIGHLVGPGTCRGRLIATDDDVPTFRTAVGAAERRVHDLEFDGAACTACGDERPVWAVMIFSRATGELVRHTTGWP